MQINPVYSRLKTVFPVKDQTIANGINRIPAGKGDGLFIFNGGAECKKVSVPSGNPVVQPPDQITRNQIFEQSFPFCSYGVLLLSGRYRIYNLPDTAVSGLLPRGWYRE
jgi:hypothetical protein